jgi:hypothetical protein
MLNNNWNLSFCGILKEAILVVSGKGVEMLVCVILAQGQTIVVDMQSSNSIDDVMMKIRCLNRHRDCEHCEHSIGGTRLHDGRANL